MKKNIERIVVGILVLVGSFVLFGLKAIGKIDVPEIVIGAMVSLDTLIVQFYFRKVPTAESETKPNGDMNGK